MPIAYTTIECPTCFTNFERIAKDQDLETVSCPICSKPLCECCDRKKCDSCDQFFCREHMMRIEDGTPEGLVCCPACVKEVEPELGCPACGSYQIEFSSYDFGRSSETGYSDAGELYHCKSCGSTGDARDVAKIPVVAVPLVPTVRRIGPVRELRYGQQGVLFPQGA